MINETWTGIFGFISADMILSVVSDVFAPEKFLGKGVYKV
jgi:hypothetical protein